MDRSASSTHVTCLVTFSLIDEFCDSVGCTPDFLETAMYVDLEKSNTEIKKQNAVSKKLLRTLLSHFV